MSCFTFNSNQEGETKDERVAIQDVYKQHEEQLS